MSSIETPAYTKLAEIYDTVMEDVDYDLWADYLDALMLQHHEQPKSIMELACGTGSLALSLDELECYNISGTDKSPQMIEQARQKNRDRRCKVDFSVMDFLNIRADQSYDVVFCVFDSINYLHTPEEILRFLEECKKLLTPNSLLIFDFTTPINSVEAIDYLHNEEGSSQDNLHFYRSSTYDEESRIHTNTFSIKKLADDNTTVVDNYVETHRQKIYTLQQMLDIIDQTTYMVEAKYDGFEFEEADSESLRITMVLRCPNTQS